MANSEDSLSNNESLHDGDGDDNEYQGVDEDNAQNVTKVGDIDYETLFSSFKVLRQVLGLNFCPDCLKLLLFRGVPQRQTVACDCCYKYSAQFPHHL